MRHSSHTTPSGAFPNAPFTPPCGFRDYKTNVFASPTKEGVAISCINPRAHFQMRHSTRLADFVNTKYYFRENIGGIGIPPLYL